MARESGTYITTTTLGQTMRAFVPHSLPPAEPELSPLSYESQNRAAEVALARLSAVSGLAPSVEWLLYSAVRKEALLTSQIEGTQATLTDLFDQEAGLDLDNRDDVEEVTNYKLLTDLGIVVEMSGMKKYRTFGYQRYIELLARSE